MPSPQPAPRILILLILRHILALLRHARNSGSGRLHQRHRRQRSELAGGDVHGDVVHSAPHDLHGRVDEGHIAHGASAAAAAAATAAAAAAAGTAAGTATGRRLAAQRLGDGDEPVLRAALPHRQHDEQVEVRVRQVRAHGHAANHMQLGARAEAARHDAAHEVAHGGAAVLRRCRRLQQRNELVQPPARAAHVERRRIAVERRDRAHVVRLVARQIELRHDAPSCLTNALRQLLPF